MMNQKSISANCTSKLNRASTDLSLLESAAETNNVIDLETNPINQSDFSIEFGISKTNAAAIHTKLREQGILDSDDTLEHWLSEISSQITDGGNLTVRQLVAGLQHFSQL